MLHESNNDVSIVKVCMAEPLNGDKPKQTIIDITVELPKFDTLASFETVREFYDTQAYWLAQALFNSLPQGTFDRLIIELMKCKTSLYRGKTNG